MFAGLLAASSLVGGVTAHLVMKCERQDNTVSQHGVSVVESVLPEAGNHFTSYQPEKYPDLTYAAENAVKAVVNIEAIQEIESSYGRSFDPFFEFFGLPQGYSRQPSSREVKAGGSGVIISPDGYIVTNNHVVENASRLKVRLNDQRTFDAHVIGTDPTTDVALIKIDGENLPALPFGSSDDLRLGEWVLAIGSPFDLQSTITAGIVSAKARNLGAIPNDFRIESFIQTDAAVNPGNSGGALVNTAGELVGINTVIKSQTGSYIGYSFAVPSSIVKKVVMDLKEFGVVQRAMLGISYSEINDEFIERFGDKYGITEKGGIYVATVDPDGAAKAAGIEEGDVVTEIDGVKIDNSATLSELMAKHRPNEKVKISVKRGDKMKQFDVVLRNKAGKAELLSKDDVDVIATLGGKFAEINDRAKKELKINGGVRVVEVNNGGLLSKVRVQEGFVITQINDRTIRTVSDLEKVNGPITLIEGVYPNGRMASYTITR